MPRNGRPDSLDREVHLLPCLGHRELSDTKVTNAGLAHLKALPNPGSPGLYLDNPAITDAGLEHLKSLPQTYLDIRETKMTAASASALRKALPKCDINTDFK